jgi:hypothetical protein
MYGRAGKEFDGGEIDLLKRKARGKYLPLTFLMNLFIQATDVVAAIRNKFHFVHNTFDQRNAHAPFFSDPDMIFDIRFGIVGLIKRFTLVRNFKEKSVVFLKNSQFYKFAVILIVGVDDEIGGDFIYRQDNLVEDDG